MILLDTNVVSELMRPSPTPSIVAWLDGQPPESIWISAISLCEIRLGLEILPQSRRRRRLEEEFDRMLDEDFEGRVLDFDKPAAEAAARIASRQRRLGRPVDARDVQIAGIAAARKATLATRNLRHFRDAGLNLVDPWSA